MLRPARAGSPAGASWSLTFRSRTLSGSGQDQVRLVDTVGRHPGVRRFQQPANHMINPIDLNRLLQEVSCRVALPRRIACQCLLVLLITSLDIFSDWFDAKTFQWMVRRVAWAANAPYRVSGDYETHGTRARRLVKSLPGGAELLIATECTWISSHWGARSNQLVVGEKMAHRGDSAHPNCVGIKSGQNATQRGNVGATDKFLPCLDLRFISLS